MNEKKPTPNASSTALNHHDSSHSNERVPITVLADYRDRGYSGVIKVPTFTQVEDKELLEFFNGLLDGSNSNGDELKHIKSQFGMCSSSIKPLESNGKKKVIMGRNLDIPNSCMPVTIFYIHAPDRYRSVNIAPPYLIPETFDQIAETQSLDTKIYQMFPYLVSDSMNEHGLILEINMRPQCDTISSQSTNPNGKIRICIYNLIRYLSDHCANIEEVLNTVKDLDIYSANSSVLSWHAGIAIMDATGRYGVLEIVDNKVCWSESAPGQTNFWQNKEAYSRSDLNSGLGRWDVLMSNYHCIASEKDMEKVMEKVTFGQYYRKDLKDLPYYPLTEEVGEELQDWIENIDMLIKKYNLKYDKKVYDTLKATAAEQTEKNVVWTTSYVLDPKNKEKVSTATKTYAYFLDLLPVKGRQQYGEEWITILSYVVNNKDLVYHLKFFEQDEEYAVPLNP